MGSTADSTLLNLRRFLVWTTIATFILIILGAAVRVAEAGVSCPDWPTCYGQWLPFPAPDGGFIDEAGVAFTTTQVLLEWSHRLLASLVGFIFLAATFYAYKASSINYRLPVLASLAILALISQIRLGGVTVWLDNVNWSVTLHLGNALVFYGLLIMLLMAASRPACSKGIDAPLAIRILFWLALIMVTTTMLLGAMVSTSYAGGVCGGLFSCAGEWWPQNDTSQQLHMLHRIAALLTFLTSMAIFLNTRNQHKELAKTGRILMIFIVLQAAIGTFVLYSFSGYASVYKILSVTHLGWGTVVFTVALTGVVKLYWGAKDPNIKILPGHN